MPEAPSVYACHASQWVGIAHADYLGGRGRSRELMRSGLDLVHVARDDEIIADHRPQAQLAVRPTRDVPWRRDSWLGGLDANAGIDDLTPLAGGKGKDGIEVELGDLRDFFNHQRDTQQHLFQGFHVCRWMPSVTLE